jgi:diguanylate cyclase (GGDEF)-like protein
MATETAPPPSDGQPQTILIIDPAKGSREKCAAILEGLGHAARIAADAFEGHALVDGTAAVIGVHPHAAPIYPRLKAAGIPLIASFTAKQGHPAGTALEIGADAYVVRPYRRDVLSLALYSGLAARLLRDRAVRAEMALAQVTGVFSGRHSIGMLHADVFKSLLPLEIRRARRHGYPIAICVVSLDPLPDAHPVTPELVAACEPFLRSAVRDVDLAVRYGDGRFLVFLPHTDGPGAITVGKRIVAGFRNCRFRAGGVTLMVTASVGIATPREGKAPSFARLIRDAHAALKAAQLKGGDRAIVR